MINYMKLSKFTISLGAYIIISASFMQQVLDTWKIIFGKDKLILIFIFFCAWVMLAVTYKSVRSGLNIKKIALIITTCAVGFIFAWRQPYLSEKAHILEYGILGWLAMRDFSNNKMNILKSVLYTLIFVAIIGSLDEGFQKILPWRYFEIRDICTNILSGILGIALFIVK